MTGTNGRASTNGQGGRDARTPAPVWPADEPGLPPLEGILPALETFDGIGDASALDIELQVSAFLAALGAGSLVELEEGEPSHEELLNGLVEICLHHLEAGPPRVVIDFLWVLDAFGVSYLHWPLHERLESSVLPSSPAWAVAVGDAEITGTYVVTHEMGDGLDVAVTARHPGAEADHVIAVYLDQNLDGLAKDLLVHPDAAQFLDMSAGEPGMAVEPVEPAAAAAMIDEGIEKVFETGALAPVAEQFAPLFTVVDHYVAKLPPGGTPPSEPEPATPAEQEAVVDRYLASPSGRAQIDDRTLLLDAVEFVVDELGGDPLRWSPVVTHLVVVGWLPLSTHGSDAGERFRALLRDFLPWAHAEHGWGDRYLSDTLAVLDAVADGDEDVAGGRIEVLEAAVAAGIDLDDETALDSFLDDYLDE